MARRVLGRSGGGSQQRAKVLVNGFSATGHPAEPAVYPAPRGIPPPASRKGRMKGGEKRLSKRKNKLGERQIPLCQDGGIRPGATGFGDMSRDALPSDLEDTPPILPTAAADSKFWGLWRTANGVHISATFATAAKVRQLQTTAAGRHLTPLVDEGAACAALSGGAANVTVALTPPYTFWSIAAKLTISIRAGRGLDGENPARAPSRNDVRQFPVRL